MRGVKCSTFNTYFMALLSYRMIATQFTEQQWNSVIALAICFTWNAVGIAKNFTGAVLYPKPLFSLGYYPHH